MMYQKKAQHPLSEGAPLLDEETREAMWQLFVHIGLFWGNVEDSTPYQSRFLTFMENRIAVNPLYRDFYKLARDVLRDLIAQHGKQKAYEFLFTDQTANQSPPATPLQFTRQYVSNEFIALQLSLGGFKAYGAINYPGYFGGANVPGQPAPYRTMKDET